VTTYLIKLPPKPFSQNTMGRILNLVAQRSQRLTWNEQDRTWATTDEDTAQRLSAVGASVEEVA
jgi:hypothetical protein